MKIKSALYNPKRHLSQHDDPWRATEEEEEEEEEEEGKFILSPQEQHQGTTV